MDADSDDSFEAFVRSKKVPVVPETVVQTPSGDADGTEEYSSHLLLTGDQILALGVRASDVELFRRMRYQDAFSLSSWYASLAQHTFRTEFVPIDAVEARTICDAYLSKAPLPSPSPLASLAARLDAAMARLACEHGVFVKLNTRSPKDVPVYDFANQSLRALLDARLDDVNAQFAQGSARTANAEMAELERQNAETAAFVVASAQWLCVRSGDEALALLARSQRIYEDLTKQLHFPPHLFSGSIAVRAFVPRVVAQPQGEFRAFVHRNRLNAVTQYYSFVRFADVVAKRDALANRLQTFFDAHLRDTFASHGSYIVDFWVDFASADLETFVIELNPFHIGAGAGLFTWREHRHLFMHGPDSGKGFELRLCERVGDNPYKVLPNQWVAHIRQHREKTATTSTRNSASACVTQ